LNPRSFCRERAFHKTLLLTYSFDPVFFEQVVLPDLWAGRSSDIAVIGDREQVKSSVQLASGQLWHLGKKYLLAGSAHGHTFHPKVILRLGETNGAIMLGSGNITSSGWGGNRELGCAWMVGPGHDDNGAWILPFLDDVTTWCANDLEREAVRRMKDVPWLASAPSNESNRTALLYSSGVRALAPTLAARWYGRRFDEVSICTGSTDEAGAFLRWAYVTFGIRRAVVALTLSNASFSLAQLADLPIELRLIPISAAQPLHAKFYFFEGQNGAAALMGSPNCSASAWLLPPTQGGNIETAQVYDDALRSDFSAVLEVFASPSFHPEEVLPETDTTTENDAKAIDPYEISGLRWDAYSEQVVAFISPSPPHSALIFLVQGAVETSMTSASFDGHACWVCAVPGGLNFQSSAFASIRLRLGEEKWETAVRWIDHIVELRHATQAARLFDPIEGLENRVSAAEQKRLIDDLHKVTEALFSGSSTFRDSGFGFSSKSTPIPATVTSPADPMSILRNLEALPDASHASASDSTGSLSLVGIFRMLFDSERAVTAADAAEDENLDEGQPSIGSPVKLPVPPSAKSSAQSNDQVDAKLQTRLATQINTFIGKLAEEEFAQKCTATQMIQAVCFPLAVALRGQRRGWVSSQSAEQWILRVTSLLFRGKITGTPGLLRLVEERYAEKGQSDIFAEIVGDGTLWMVLIAMMGSPDWSNAEDFIERALLLREVFRSKDLISSVRPSRLTGLLDNIRIADARAVLLTIAPAVSSILDQLEFHLESGWTKDLTSQDGRSVPNTAKDILWRPNVGWGICITGGERNGYSQIRLRGESKRVKGTFYVNVSGLCKHDPQVSLLLHQLSDRITPGGHVQTFHT
jgi:HKD family nuclease